ncbi:MAG TPA: hypothetical protein VG757_16100 [Devosia sp.]|nr:hypothetical protein [Devosia sp.]
MVLIVLFGAFELVVLWLALHPNVADDYRAYYIDRTASCFPREDSVADGSYLLGNPISFVPDRNGHLRDNLRWCGFMPPNNSGIRSFGDYGILRLRFPVPNEDLLLTFASFANASAKDPPREVSVVVNGQRIDSVIYTDAKRINGVMVIPAEVAKSNPDGGLDIRFEVPRIGPPGTNSEPVTLQLRLEALRVLPVSKAPPMPNTPVASPEAKTAKK